MKILGIFLHKILMNMAENEMKFKNENSLKCKIDE